ncbi:hypothetical protein MMC07_004046 [Pseudocyphellaria aurata]|nr:hypothetical protein [Pseudocyphellaria aurata]
MRSILLLLLALLPGIYAHPLGRDQGGDQSVKFSKEKRCVANFCTQPGPLPYPRGFSAKTCAQRFSDGKNPWAIGLAVAPKKRSISIRTTTTTTTNNHTESTDRLSLRPRRRDCSNIASISDVSDFTGPNGNTAEVLLRQGAFYFLVFTFDTVVDSISVWAHDGGPHYTRVQTVAGRGPSGAIPIHRIAHDTNVHFEFHYHVDSSWAAFFGESPLNLHIHGIVQLLELS